MIDMRKYTVAEIEEMRKSVTCMFPSGVSYYPAARAKEIEERLRTYMTAGVTPKELNKAAGEYLDRDA
jgi:hypothetical protein